MTISAQHLEHLRIVVVTQPTRDWDAGEQSTMARAVVVAMVQIKDADVTRAAASALPAVSGDGCGPVTLTYFSRPRRGVFLFSDHVVEFLH